MKITIFSLCFSLISIYSFAQCLPDGITFSSQEQIDNFQTDYPECTEIIGKLRIEGSNIDNLNGLNSITSIGGNLEIVSTYLNNINGLGSISSIGGDLYLYHNYSLTSLDGLTSLESIGMRFYSDYCDNLSDISALHNIVVIPGDFIIKSNSSLTNLIGLNNLTQVGGNFEIWHHSALQNFEGLNSLVAVGGDCYINYNALQSFYGLNSLSSINGELYISNNSSLIDFEPLSNLNYIGSRFSIVQNQSLQTLAGLEGLTTIYDDFVINNNLSLLNIDGINNIDSLIGKLSITGNFELVSIEAIENIIYAESGIVISSNLELTNLVGFNSNLNYIGGVGLRIDGNISLLNLEELSNITHTSHLSLSHNYSLINLNGLENLTEIENQLSIYENTSLGSLSGLENIASVNRIYIGNNPGLSDISALNLSCPLEALTIFDQPFIFDLNVFQNIEEGSLEQLFLYNNESLSECSVDFICNYLLDPDGELIIQNNATGCNSDDEILENCQTQAVESNSLTETLSYPNPASDKIYLNPNLDYNSFHIYNRLGQEVLNGYSNQINVDISNLQAGVYLISLKNDRSVLSSKLIIQ